MRTRPVLVYDGDCAFCTTSVMLAERRFRLSCEITPWQSADLGFLGVTQRQAEYELVWVTPTGTVYGGAQAAAKVLMSAGGGWTLVGALLTLPPLRWIAHGVYRLIANNRQRMPGGTHACALPADQRSNPPSQSSGHLGAGA
ncbi:thiol-disulfide oxidoreductase DCC family protein [Streptomyces sp. S186]|uniref:thiol-disulfide oxidoreductase DCC family protein n=1 Tax=Streptomyces sp. S186 TaxID=3434395 RepID=UPI003F6720D7